MGIFLSVCYLVFKFLFYFTFLTGLFYFVLLRSIKNVFSRLIFLLCFFILGNYNNNLTVNLANSQLDIKHCLVWFSFHFPPLWEQSMQHIVHTPSRKVFRITPDSVILQNLQFSHVLKGPPWTHSTCPYDSQTCPLFLLACLESLQPLLLLC